MIAPRDHELSPEEVRELLGHEAAGMTDAEVMELNEQMAGLASFLCDAALDCDEGSGSLFASGKAGS